MYTDLWVVVVTLLFYLLQSNLLFVRQTFVAILWKYQITTVCSSIVDFNGKYFRLNHTYSTHIHKYGFQSHEISFNSKSSIQCHNFYIQPFKSTANIVTCIYPFMRSDSLAFMTYQTEKNICQIAFLILGFWFFSPFIMHIHFYASSHWQFIRDSVILPTECQLCVSFFCSSFFVLHYGSVSHSAYHSIPFWTDYILSLLQKVILLSFMHC